MLNSLQHLFLYSRNEAEYLKLKEEIELWEHDRLKYVDLSETAKFLIGSIPLKQDLR